MVTAFLATLSDAPLNVYIGKKDENIGRIYSCSFSTCDVTKIFGLCVEQDLNRTGEFLQEFPAAIEAVASLRIVPSLIDDVVVKVVQISVVVPEIVLQSH